MRIVLATLLALTASFTVLASEDMPAAHRIDLGGSSVVYTPIAVIQGAPGESQDLVIARAAKVLKTYTEAHQLEACGDLTMNADQTLRIVLGTIDSHIGCISQTVPAPGYVVLGLTIHSHPTRRSFSANPADIAANSVSESSKAHLHNGETLSVHSSGFSKQDFLSHGYLVANGHLLYQHGEGTTQDRGLVDSLPTATAAPSALAQVK